MFPSPALVPNTVNLSCAKTFPVEDASVAGPSKVSMV